MKEIELRAELVYVFANLPKECKYDKKKLCGGPNDVNIYDISVEDELVATIPKMYRPKYSMSFICNSDKGVSNINVLSNGEIRWAGTYGTTTKWFSLENICFKRPGGGINPMHFETLLGKEAKKNFSRD